MEEDDEKFEDSLEDHQEYLETALKQDAEWLSDHEKLIRESCDKVNRETGNLHVWELEGGRDSPEWSEYMGLANEIHAARQKLEALEPGTVAYHCQKGLLEDTIAMAEAQRQEMLKDRSIDFRLSKLSTGQRAYYLTKLAKDQDLTPAQFARKYRGADLEFLVEG